MKKDHLTNLKRARCRSSSAISCYKCATFHPEPDLPLDVENSRRLDVELSQLFSEAVRKQAERTKPFKMNANHGHERRTGRTLLPQPSGELLRQCIRRLWLNRMPAIAAFAILLMMFAAGCETASKTDSAQHPPTFSDVNLFPPSTNILDQADVISITFRYSTNFDTVQKIGLDGMVNLEGVGEVKAAGKTVRQLQDELTTLYKSQVKDDPITVKIVAPGAAVYVTGAVNHPGKIPMDRPMTVIDAIAEAGGFDQYRAKLSKVSILRVDGNTQHIYWLNVNHVLNGEDPNPFFLKPFDIINVPSKTFNF
jgi:polysaccharide biosynthesis/export protein